MHCRFEALCTDSKVVDASSEFCSITRFRLGEHSIVLAAEIDAYDPTLTSGKQPPGLESYVELKTYK